MHRKPVVRTENHYESKNKETKMVLSRQRWQQTSFFQLFFSVLGPLAELPNFPCDMCPNECDVTRQFTT